MTMSLQELAGHPQAAALGWALVHSLWQLALVAALLASVDVFLRGSPQRRYLAAGVALALMLALPVATFFSQAASESRRAAVTPLALRLAAPVAEADAPKGAEASPPPPAAAWRARVDAALPALVLVWGAGVALLSVRVLGGWVVAQRLKRSGRPILFESWHETARRVRERMRIRLPLRLRESALVDVPTVVGWLRPVVLLPVSTLAGLSPVQLEALLAHELAHIRRFDYLVNLAQTFAETLLFYHPAVWWVSRRMRVEREHCCDDAAVGVCGDAVGYARALAEIEGLRTMGPRLAVAASGGALWLRVARLVAAPPPSASRSSRLAAGLLALATLAAFGLGAGVPLDGGTLRPGAEPAPPRVALADFGVTNHYIRCLAELGYENLSPGQLISLRTSGVSPSYIEGLKEMGYEHLSVSRLVMLRSQGVTPAFVEGLREQGYENLSPLSLVALRSHGITPGYVEGLRDLGYEGLSTSLLIGLRSQGVDPGFVEGLQEEGYEGLAPGELVLLRQSGVTPQYVGRLREAGCCDLSTTDLIEQRQSGQDKPCGKKKRHTEEEEL